MAENEGEIIAMEGAAALQSRRLVTALALGTAVAIGGIISPAGAAPVEYDYTGTNFTSVTCLAGSCTPATTPTTSNQITGDVVIDGGLPAASVTTNPTISSFSFTDGVNTITSSVPGASISLSSFQTGATGAIQNYFLDPTLSQVLGSSSLDLTMGISSVTGDSSTYQSTTGFNINAYSTATTPTPGMWTSPPGPSLWVSLNPLPPNSLFPDSKPTLMNARLTLAPTEPDLPNTYRVPVTLPSSVTNLQQAAEALGGYTSFDWTQTITAPGQVPFRECNDDSCNDPMSISGTTPDVPMHGWDYCNPNSIRYDSTVFGDCSNNYPFYYNSNDPRLVAANAGTTLNFYDSPADACLEGPLGSDSLLYTLSAEVKDRCDNTTESGALMFTTSLVGVKGKTAAPLPFVFTWDDTFNGWFGEPGTGGIITVGAPGTDIEVDPESGTGGITITSVNGVATVSAAEPPSLAVFGIAILFMWTLRRKRIH
jgi:hypothetical protein